jgi:PAS domain S-box-containing protein
MTAPAPEGPGAEADGHVEQSVFRSLFSAYPDALLLVDQAGVIVMANPAAARLLGYEIGDLGGLPVDALVPEAIRPRHAAYRQAYGRAPQPRPMGTQMELVARRKDGTNVMVEIALSPLQGQGVPLVVAAIRDIGAYPRVKQALQRARYAEHLAQLGRLAVDTREPQALLGEVPQIACEALEVEAAVVYLLEPGRLEFRIVAGGGALGRSVVGQERANRSDTLPGLVAEQSRTVRSMSLKDETRFSMMAPFMEAGVSSVVGVPLFDRGRVVGVLAALSSRGERFGDDEARFLESLANLLATSLQRAQTEEALNHSQRLESVGQLTGGIAHDFNNLLTVIQGNLQVLEELPALDGDASGQQLVAAAFRATRRAAELTSKLLAFSRRQVLQPTSVNVAALLGSLTDMLRRTVDQHIRIEVDAGDRDLRVVADPGQLESALLNIAINARDAMPTGGVLRFEARASAIAPLDVERGVLWPGAPDGGFVRIAVSDTGSGMSEEVRERAFEPFFTTKAAGRGTGLGLSTVYGFVKQSRGSIAIESAQGIGTSVAMVLPCPSGPDASTAARDNAGAEVPAGLRVLLVEDDAEVRAVMSKFLEALGCGVHAVSSAEHALVWLDGGSGVELLLTDIALGTGMRGTALAREVQQRHPAMRVLLMSGFSAELIEADRDSPSSWELLPKPCTRDELANAIARVVASGGAAPPR